MKIVHAHWGLNTGGTETMMVDIMNEQAKEHKVWCLIVNDAINENVRAKISEKVHFVCYRRNPGASGILSLLKFNWDLYRIKPNIIHTHGVQFSRIIKYNKAPIVLTIHSTLGTEKYLDKPSQLCFISDAIRRYSIKHGYDGVVVYNGIHIENICKRKRMTSDKHIYRIVQVGRLEEIKGPHLLIKAAAILVSWGINDFAIDFIGMGSQYGHLLSMIKENHLEDKVSLLGLKNREYVYSHLCDYDLLVQPSLSEGFGLTIAEGMAAGIAVLTSNLDGPMEVIGNGKYGETFMSGDEVDLARKLEMFISGEMPDKTASALAHLNDNFTIQVTTQKYISVYDTLINKLRNE